MSLLLKEETDSIKVALDKFQRKLSYIEQDSSNAYALVIFINACFDTGNFQSNRYSALVHFPEAREAAGELERLRHKEIRLFNQAISYAHEIIIEHRIVHVDLCFG